MTFNEPNVYATTGYEQSAQNLGGVSLTTDGVFADDGAAHQLATVTGNAGDGYTVRLAVRVDTSTSPSAGRAAPGPGAPSGS